MLKVELIKLPKPKPQVLGNEAVMGKIEALAGSYGVNPTLAKAIIKCESGFNENAKHYNTDGSFDQGLWQINSTHVADALKMGLSISNSHDSLIYGFYLLERNGTKDWEASRYCWSKLI